MEVKRIHIWNVANFFLLGCCSIITFSLWPAESCPRLCSRCQGLDSPVCPRFTALSLALFESFAVTVLYLLLQFYYFLYVRIGRVLQHLVNGHRIVDIREVESVLQQRVDVVVPP